MADWIHCNACFRQPGDGRNYSLTNCGHIFCHECIKERPQGKCPMCSSSCTMILLTSQMKPHVELFFSSPAVLIKKNYKEFQNIVQVIEFQESHRKRLTAHKEKVIKNGGSHQSSLKKDIQVLKEENSYLKKIIKGMGGSSSRPNTPRQSSPHSQPRTPGESYYEPMKVSPSNSNSIWNRNRQVTPPMPARVTLKNTPPVRFTPSPLMRQNFGFVTPTTRTSPGQRDSQYSGGKPSLLSQLKARIQKGLTE